MMIRKITAFLTATALAAAFIPMGASAYDTGDEPLYSIQVSDCTQDYSMPESYEVTCDSVEFPEETYEETFEATEDAEPLEMYLYISNLKWNSVDMMWTQIDGADKYRIYKYNTSKGIYEKYKDISGTSATVTGLKGSRSYRFCVAALDTSWGDAVELVRSDEAVFTTPKKPSDKLAAPTGLTASARTQKTVTLKWNTVKGADGYRVYKYNVSKGKFLKYKDVTKATCKVSGLKAGATYKFMVASLVMKNGKYVVQNKSTEYSAATSVKSSGSNSNKNNTYVTDGTYVIPGNFSTPDMGSSIKKAIATTKIGYYKMESNPFSANGKICIGKTIYAGQSCGLALYFNRDGLLYEYMIKVPSTYYQFLDAVDVTKKNYNYDYYYDDGFYFFGPSVLKLTLNYDNGATYIFVNSSLYKY